MARIQDIEKIIDDYEKKLRQLDKVTLQNSNGIEIYIDFNTKSVIDFLKDFFYHNHVSEADTGSKSFYKTSQQKVNSITKEVTYYNQRRTVGDLFRLALKYYSEDVSLYEIMEALYHITNNRIDNKIYGKANSSMYGVIYMNICSAINRRVFNYKPGDYTGYKFDSGNNFNTQTSNLQEEFLILGTDYNLLFDSKFGKELVEKKKNKKTLFAIPASLTQKDLDKLVAEKLKKLKSKVA